MGVALGSMRQMQALAAVGQVRARLEPMHRGEDMGPDATVRWSGGSCLYEEASKLSAKWIQNFAQNMSGQLAADIARIERVFRKPDREQFEHIQIMIGVCEKWVLPIARETRIAQLMPGAQAACYRASGSLRRPEERLRKAFIGSEFVESYFAGFSSGLPWPAAAAERGERVSIENNDRRIDWQEQGHLDDRVMMGFNIGLSDEVYATMLALDRARNCDYDEAPMNIPILLSENLN